MPKPFRQERRERNVVTVVHSQFALRSLLRHRHASPTCFASAISKSVSAIPGFSHATAKSTPELAKEKEKRKCSQPTCKKRHTCSDENISNHGLPKKGRQNILGVSWRTQIATLQSEGLRRSNTHLSSPISHQSHTGSPRRT